MPAPMQSHAKFEDSVIRTSMRREMENANVFLTKHQILAPVAPPAKPQPPKYLGKRGMKLWNDMLASLNDSLFIPIVAAQMELYVNTYNEWTRVRLLVESDGYILWHVQKNGKRVAKINPMTRELKALNDSMRFQFRTLFFALAHRGQQFNGVQRLEAINEEIDNESNRGSMLGGIYSERERRKVA